MYSVDQTPVGRDRIHIVLGTRVGRGRPNLRILRAGNWCDVALRHARPDRPFHKVGLKDGCIGSSVEFTRTVKPFRSDSTAWGPSGSLLHGRYRRFSS